MFNKPSTYSWGGLANPNGWVYRTSDSHYINPCWELYQKNIWVVSKATYYANATATAKSLSTGTRRTSRHGQYQNSWDSYGTASSFSTTHN